MPRSRAGGHSAAIGAEKMKSLVLQMVGILSTESAKHKAKGLRDTKYSVKNIRHRHHDAACNAKQAIEAKEGLAGRVLPDG